MTQFSKTYEAKWADMDPNRHMRHSVYLDYGAQSRVALFHEYGMSIEKIAKIGFGPILFREEIKYLKEVNSMDQFTVFCELKWMYEDGSRWSFLHRMFKDTDIPIAELTVDGAWLNLDTRKLGVPSNKLIEVMKEFPRTNNFELKESD